MITISGKYYLYRHIRLDTNEVFYIGVSRKKKKAPYWRMNDKSSRSAIWKGIAAKTSILSEIVLETDDVDFLYKKEKEFILLYGRLILGTGTLINVSEGGETVLNVKVGSRTALAQKNKQSGHFERLGKLAGERLAKNPIKHWEGKKGDEMPASNEVFCYCSNGDFFKRFSSHTECALELKIKSIAQIRQSMKRNGSCHGYKHFDTYQGSKIEPFGKWGNRHKGMYTGIIP